MLALHPCRSACAWSPTGAAHDDEPVFACSGCGSEWVRSQAWSPRELDGSWPAGVREQLAQRG